MSGKGFTRGLAGRADLVRARQLGDPALEAYLAGLLGYEFVAPEPTAVEKEAEPSIAPSTAQPTSVEIVRDVRFWQPTRFQILERPVSVTRGTAVKPARPSGRLERRSVDLSFLPLSSNASVLTRLRTSSPTKAISGELDVDRIVEEWGRGRFLASMPRTSRTIWGRSVQVLVDRSRRLIPYWDDQSLVCGALRSTYPPEGYSEVVLPEGRFEPSWMRVGGQVVEYTLPPPGSAVVALGDLGALARGGSRLIALWAERGRRLRDLEVTPLALVPFRRAACPEELSRYWTILPWELSAELDAPRSVTRKQTRSLRRS